MHFVFSLYVTNGQVNHEEKYAQERNPSKADAKRKKLIFQILKRQ